MDKFTAILTRFEIKHTQGALILNTTDYNVLKNYLGIPLDTEGFKTKYLAVGENFEILDNPDGGKVDIRLRKFAHSFMMNQTMVTLIVLMVVMSLVFT